MNRPDYHCHYTGGPNRTPATSILSIQDSRACLTSRQDELWRRPQTIQEKVLFCTALVLMGLLLVLVITLSVVASSKSASIKTPNRKTSDEDVCNTDSCKEAATWLNAAMNKSVDPCQNFYQYACGGWIAKHPIPPTERRYTTFDVVEEQLLQNVKDILLNSLSKKTTSKSVANSQNLFRGCINKDTRQKVGTNPVKDLLAQYGGWPLLNPGGWKGDNFKWMDVVAQGIRKLDMDPFLDVGVMPDDKNTEYYIIFMDQPGFIPGRNQMMNMTENDRTIEVIDAYKQYITKSAELLGATKDEQLKQAVEDMVNFESEIAKLTRSNEERRDPNSIYNKMTIAEFQNYTQSSTVYWRKFFDILLKGFDPADDTTEIIVAEVEYMKQMIQLAKKTNVKTLANYIGWKIVSSVGPFTTVEFRDAVFQFQKVKYGIEEPQETYKICSNDVIQLLGFAVGRLYVDKYLGLDAKHDVENLVENLRSAYRQSLLEVNWMDEDTKKAAVQKLNEMISMMAYPEWIMNDERLDEYYKDVLPVNTETYFMSRLNVQSALIDKFLKRWNKKTNRTSEWVTEPPVVNAFYNPSANSITFPAGILNMPFYKYKRLQSMNYGGIGMVIGHEMSHGFDDQGSQYDKNGNLKNWWSNDTRKHFEEKAQCFRDQYSSLVEPVTGLNLNGNNTLGENIADNGAIRNSYRAYNFFVQRQKRDNEPKKRLPGLNATSDQLFFLGYASIWCGSERKESLEETIQYDAHSPTEFRVLIPLANSDDFSRAFSCPVGSAMNPPKKCVLW